MATRSHESCPWLDPKPYQVQRQQPKGYRPHAQALAASASTTASLVGLPAELRVEIYKYLLPGPGQCSSSYTGLRNSCRLIRDEYDHEAENDIPHIYDNLPLRISRCWYIRPKSKSPKNMTNIATVKLDTGSFVVTRMARFPKKYGCNPDPGRHLIHSAVRMAFERMDRMIKDRTGTTINRRTWSKGERRPVKCEIDRFVMRWTNFARTKADERVNGRTDIGSDREKILNDLPVIRAPTAGLPSNHDRLWDVMFDFDDRGCFVQATWRRHTPLDAQREAEDDFMPLPKWLELPPRSD
ncbi:hypothetical protein CC86DRAFT_378490 [Ophiobolus disseminans]|uniref:Uncharacterized protein n=1 Tax=Ophiobolus disseminans TaxID=1469910 RepID=A0A6A7AEG1_9PLEO|nr:hypothetical protein CC86DRAFT_378490 [Ophiobolus disseminans]